MISICEHSQGHGMPCPDNVANEQDNEKNPSLPAKNPEDAGYNEVYFRK